MQTRDRNECISVVTFDQLIQSRITWNSYYPYNTVVCQCCPLGKRAKLMKFWIQPQRMLLLLHLLWQRIVIPLIRAFICRHLPTPILRSINTRKNDNIHMPADMTNKNINFSIKFRIACDIERMHLFWIIQFRRTWRCRTRTIFAMHRYVIPFRDPQFHGKYCCSGSILFLWEEINTFDQYWNVTVGIGNESDRIIGLKGRGNTVFLVKSPMHTEIQRKCSVDGFCRTERKIIITICMLCDFITKWIWSVVIPFPTKCQWSWDMNCVGMDQIFLNSFSVDSKIDKHCSGHGAFDEWETVEPMSISNFFLFHFFFSFFSLRPKRSRQGSIVYTTQFNCDCHSSE